MSNYSEERIIVIEEIDKLTQEAANAALKYSRNLHIIQLFLLLQPSGIIYYRQLKVD